MDKRTLAKYRLARKQMKLSDVNMIDFVVETHDKFFMSVFFLRCAARDVLKAAGVYAFIRRVLNYEQRKNRRTYTSID